MTGRPSGSVRIVAGSKRGRRLRVPAGGATRPTSEKVREAVFDVLGPVEELAALDLFAGTGAMGLEALSRGAARCVFVEEDPAVVAVLRKNIEALEFGPRCRVIETGYEEAVRSLARRGDGFDLLFVDPPYRMLAKVEVTLKPLVDSLLACNGVAVIESDKSSQVTLGGVSVFDRTYGDTRVTMIRRRSTP